MVGFGVAAQLAAQALTLGEPADIAALRNRLEAELTALWPKARVNGANAARLPNTASVTFYGDDGRPENGEELLMRLDRAGVCVSMGAACSTGGNEPSHVLTAMGLKAAEAEATLRFSLGRNTGQADVARALDALATIKNRGKVAA